MCRLNQPAKYRPAKTQNTITTPCRCLKLHATCQAPPPRAHDKRCTPCKGSMQLQCTATSVQTHSLRRSPHACGAGIAGRATTPCLLHKCVCMEGGGEVLQALPPGYGVCWMEHTALLACCSSQVQAQQILYTAPARAADAPLAAQPWQPVTAW